MMFIITLKDRPDGVFSIIDRMSGDQIIPIFEEEDDADRYHELLEMHDAYPDMQVYEIEKDVIISACEEREQRYAIITVDDFIIPPKDLV